MAELWTHKPLFAGRNPFDHVKTTLQVLGKPDAEFISKLTNSSAVDFLNTLTIEDPQDLHEVVTGFPSDGIDLLKNMLHLDPGRRFTATMALAHPYFENYHDESDEPIGVPYVDPLEMRRDVTVEEWRSHVWNLLETFVPNISLNNI